MNKHKAIFYFDQHPIEEGMMEEIIAALIRHSPAGIEKYGTSFQKMSDVFAVELKTLVEIVLGYPKHSFGTLCLRDSQRKNSFYFEYCGKGFWRVEGDISAIEPGPNSWNGSQSKRIR